MTQCEYAGRARVPTPALRFELAGAACRGEGVAGVLRKHEISRGTYYRWWRIARGHLTHWWDGCAVDPDLRQACWDMAVEVTSARIEHGRAELADLMARAPIRAPVPLNAPAVHPHALHARAPVRNEEDVA